MGVPVAKAAGAVASRELSAASLRVARSLHDATQDDYGVDAGIIYVCGRGWGSEELAQVQRFGLNSDTWESLPPMCLPRVACAMASVGGKLYIMGGVDTWRLNAGFLAGTAQAVNDPCQAECFDPVSGTWELLPAVNRPRTHATAATAGGSIYLFGGLSLGNVLNSVERFDPQQCGGTWETLDNMPTARFECASTSFGNRLYVLGGADLKGEALAAAESFDPKTGHWTILTCPAASAIWLCGCRGKWPCLCLWGLRRRKRACRC